MYHMQESEREEEKSIDSWTYQPIATYKTYKNANF